MKLPQHLIPRQVTIPKEFYTYWHDYGRCKACCQEIRHELHLYNHYKRYHYKVVPRFFVYFQYTWVEVNAIQYAVAKTPLFRRPTAIIKGY